MAIFSDMLAWERVRSRASSMSIRHLVMRSAKDTMSPALANWKCPLSVIIPPMSIRAMSRVISFPEASMRSLIISQHDVLPSSQWNMRTWSHLPVDLWWSMTTASSGTVCSISNWSGEEVSTTTTCS